MPTFLINVPLRKALHCNDHIILIPSYYPNITMKVKSIFLAFSTLIIGLFSLQAQPINRSTPEANLKAAEEAEAASNPYEALDRYEKAYSDNKEKAIAVKIAKMNYDLRDYDRAEKGFKKLTLRDRRGEYTELKYYQAMCLKFLGQYPEAIDMFNQYITDGTDEKLKKQAKMEITGCELARKAKQPDNLKVDNLGKKANSAQTEAAPSYSNGELYFASLRGKEVVVLDGKEGDWHAKIYNVTPKQGGEYGEPTALGVEINREGFHQGNVSISPDGKTMYFTRIELNNNVMSASKVYYAKKNDEGWGAANEVSGANGDFIAKHPCEGELFGEKVLFFVSDMPGGQGGYDLYYAPKKTDGVFGLPVNLGPSVNTAGEEASPFYRDGKLYFSSNGRPTFGGLDVFESQWNGSVWSEPKQMPMGVNSSVDDLFYTQLPDGMSGYVVSNRPGPNNLKSKTCCDDIYAWELERIKVDLLVTTFRKRTTKDKEKENPALTGCKVMIYDVTDKTPKPIEERVNAAANDFSFSLQPEKSYLVIAERADYTPIDTVKFNTVGVKKSTKVEKKITFRRAKKVEEDEYEEITKNTPIVLENILYDFDKWNIRPDAEPDLQYLTEEVLKKYPEIKIELSSHTDSRGKDSYNEELSQKRAESAKSWIVAKGVSADRIVAKGYGEYKLVNGCSNGVNCTEEEHQANRRTEFKIIEGPTSITVKERVKKDKKN